MDNRRQNCLVSPLALDVELSAMNRKITRLGLVCVLSACLLAGCVERQLTITSEPSGALVYLSDVEVGRTPVTVDFTFYGDYEVILRHEGSQTLKTHTRIDPPLYDIPPWDLISQAFVPWTYRYKVSRHFELLPLSTPDDKTLLQNARQMEELNLQPVPR